MKSLFFYAALLLTAATLLAEEPPVIEMERGVGRFLAKLERDQKAHVAFLGGSITENPTGHTKRVAEWLKEQWPQTEFTFTNAGLSSTCSLTGALRVGAELLAAGPVDLLIVEFAVNDDQDAGHDRKTAIRGLEGILRQYFVANPEGDAISVQFVNPSILAQYQAGEEPLSVAAHKTVAKHYGIPSVDVGLALSRAIANGTMTWERDYKDTHPNATGYQFASDLITSVIADSSPVEKSTAFTLPEPIDPGSYSRIEIVDPQKLSWLGGWRYEPISELLLLKGNIRERYKRNHALRTEEAGDYLYYNFYGSSLIAFILAGPDAGTIEVSVDGGDWRAIELYHSYSKTLNYPRSVILAQDLPQRGHSVAIRTAKAKPAESEGHAATFLYFAVGD